jgi:hypothetical protein
MRKLILARGANVALSKNEAGDVDEIGARSGTPDPPSRSAGAILLVCIVVGVVVITSGLRERGTGER